MWPLSAAKPTARARALIALAALALAGCGSAPRETFDLTRADSGAAPRPSMRALRTTLAINEPEANVPANSDRIVIRTGPQEIAYLADAQWADRLPRLVQARLIEGFEHTSISAMRPGPTASFTLATDIRRFEIDVTRQAAIVEISARILRDRDASVRAARVFIGQAEASHSTGAPAAQALEEALERATRQIVQWTSLTVGGEPRQRQSLAAKPALSASAAWGAVAQAQTDASPANRDK
ncbi:MAG: membrane integrity-associated transporter subunit PqiC [Methylocystis sp.]|nr:membrane integrity-associated transporter subunit PqiC [Methylocystis sp.]